MADQEVDQTIDSAQRVASDRYDRGIIPAEVAARKAREGEGYKKLPTEQDLYDTPTDSQTNSESIHTTHGYSMDREGLLNNYAVEPEMYYEVPGDARQQRDKDIAARQAELKEVNSDKIGELTAETDKRGKGTGMV